MRIAMFAAGLLTLATTVLSWIVWLSLLLALQLAAILYPFDEFCLDGMELPLVQLVPGGSVVEED
eukprot:4430630-Pyramimonas_sp.AAC.1